MIKLTEIISTAGQYDSDVGKNTISYKLRDVFVNPTHVIMMGSNVTLKCTVTGTPESVMEKLLQKID